MKKSKQYELKLKIRKIKESMDYVPEIEPNENYPR